LAQLKNAAARMTSAIASNSAERIVRRAPQPHARGAEAAGVAGVAGRTAGRCARVGNVKNNDPTLIEPVAAA
jgi:hypothetical protein